MIVIADTGPINYLLQLGLIHLLADRYDRVLLPAAVLQELKDPGAPRLVRQWIATPPEWVEVIYDIPADPTLPAQLGPGEREAITFALRWGVDLALDDERARVEAKRRGLVPLGTLLLLAQAAQQQSIPLSETLDALIKLGFYIDSRLYAEVLALGKRASTP